MFSWHPVCDTPIPPNTIAFPLPGLVKDFFLEAHFIAWTLRIAFKSTGPISLVAFVDEMALTKEVEPNGKG